ncbi:MAG: hypothetical protein K5686_02395 [Lachnospiraceae bacterium]|nr:hypothetical protein [Lachnospiraceae bacterium]
MNDKEQRALWLAQLKSLQEKLDTGRGVIFGRGFSEAHDKLVAGVENVCLILEGYYDQDSLSAEQGQQLKLMIDELKKNAGDYIDSKNKKGGYSLQGDAGNDIKKAKGDKRTRLEAADELRGLAEFMGRINDGLIEQAKQEEQAKRELALNDPGKERVTRRALSLQQLKLMEDDEKAVRDVQATVISSKMKMNVDREAYDRKIKNAAYGKDTVDDMSAGYKLHRGDILDFNTDAGFVKNYDKYRLTIYKSVKNYRELEELKEKDEVKFREALGKMHMTQKAFDDMSDKINVIELEGEYLDVRADIVANPAYISMNEDARKRFRKMSIEELDNEIAVADAEDAENADRKRLLEDMKKLKGMAEYGVMENPESTLNRKDSLLDKAGGKKTSTTLAFNTRYEDHGGKSIKEIFTKKGFKEYFGAHKFGVKYSDATTAFTNGVKEYGDFLNVGTNVLKGKYRVAKLGGKVKSEHGSVQAGAHVTMGTVKTAANVGASISSSHLWETKIYANASANAYGVRGVGKYSMGIRKDWLKHDGKVEGNIGSAAAIAQGGLGMVRYKDDKENDREGFGVVADVTVGAAVFEGSVSGGITIFGVRFGGKVTGAAAGIGFKNRFVLTGDVLSFGLSAMLGLGAGFEVSVDISGLKEKFKNWRKRGQQHKKLREKKAREKAEKNGEKKDLLSEFEVIEKEDKGKGQAGPGKK